MSGAIHSTGANIEVLNYNTNPSVKKYQYDLKESSEDVAQIISDDYFELENYTHSVTVNWNVETYIWDYNNLTTDVAKLTLYNDITDKVISVSYNCDADNDIKTSATLTLLVPPDDDYWYSNRSYDVRENRFSGSTGFGNTNWLPQIYCIKEIITHNDVNTVRELGFFLPDDTSYSYDCTTNTLSVQLQNLSYRFTAEGGGVIVTALRSYNYYYDMPYNHDPTKITAYKLEDESPIIIGDEKTVEKSDVLSDYEIDKQNLLHAEQNALDNIPSRAVIYGTASAIPQPNPQFKTINTPLPLSISGYDNGDYMMWDGLLMTMLIYRIAMNRMDVILNNYSLPLQGFKSPSQDAELTSKSDIFPNGWDFDNGTDVFTIAKTILSDRYYNSAMWVDEERYLCVDSKPMFSTTWRQGIYYREYGELIISEDISINESDFYTAVEVYGKDNEYYGICDGTINGFKIIVNPDSSSDWYNSLIPYVSLIPKTKVITDDSIESDADCFNLATYEYWKSICNNVTISVKIRDNHIEKFKYMSHVVGEQFLEYRLTQGNGSNGKTLKCVINKASLSDGIWSLELKPFNSFAISYDWYDVKAYYTFKSKYYDEFLGAKWNQEEIDWYNGHTETYTSQKEKHTLAQPVIIAYQILDNDILRLYISSIDIGLSVVKVWMIDENGAVNEGAFLGESVDTDGTDELPWGTPHAQTVTDIEDGHHIYKVFDYPITQSGTYSFNCQLYNMFYESSVGSNSVVISVSSSGETPDINKIYLTNELAQKLTTENNERLTI